MRTLIRKHYILLWAICLSFLPLIGFSQNETKPVVIFKIVNYSEYYQMKDSIVLSVANTSDKPLLYTIGEESFNQGHWSYDILDLLAPNPLEANIIKYKIIKPKKSTQKTIHYGNWHYRAGNSQRGLSLPVRFVLRFHNLNKVATYNDEATLVSKVFKYR